MDIDRSIQGGVLNLHDAFLNASLAKKLMSETPLFNDPILLYSATDRGRLERMWIGFLAVLVESWHSEQMLPVREFVNSITKTESLTELLRRGRRDGSIEKMMETRHYMFHRDQRELLDKGREGPIGGLEYHCELHNTFADILLAAVKELPQ